MFNTFSLAVTGSFMKYYVSLETKIQKKNAARQYISYRNTNNRIKRKLIYVRSFTTALKIK